MVARLGEGDNDAVKKLGLCLFIVALAFLGLVFYQPLWQVIRRGLSDEGRWSLSAVVSILGDSYYIHLIAFTAKQAALSTLVSLMIGVPGAYVLTYYRFRGKSLVRSLTVVPFVLPAITVALGFVLFFGNNGVLNRLIMKWFGLSNPPLLILYSLSGIVLAHAFYNAPIVTRIVNAAWERMEPELEEAAAALGAGRVRRFVEITAPLLAPALVSSSALVFILTFLSFPIVLALGGARYATIEVGIYNLTRTLLDYRLGSALILVETVLSLGISYLYLNAESRLAHRLEGTGRIHTRRIFQTPFSVGKLSIILYGISAGIFFIGPIASIIVDSLQLQGEWSIGNFRRIIELSYNPFLGSSPLSTVKNSLIIGAIGTMISVPLGTAVAIFAVRSRIIGRRILETVLMAPLAVSSVAIGFALLQGLNRIPLVSGGTLIAIAVAHSILIYPFVVRVVRPVLEGLDPALSEAARSLGASRLRAFFEVELPRIARGIVVAAIFAFALSIGEMSATIMLMRPGLATMPIAVYSLLSARQFGAASAMAVVLIMVTGFAFVVIDRFGEGGFGWQN